MGITAPSSSGLVAGLSTVFSTGAAHRLENGAVIQDVAALHVQIGHSNKGPSVSTQIAALRNMLLGAHSGSKFSEVAKVLSCYLLLDLCVDVCHLGRNTFGRGGSERGYHCLIDSAKERGQGVDRHRYSAHDRRCC